VREGGGSGFIVCALAKVEEQMEEEETTSDSRNLLAPPLSRLQVDAVTREAGGPPWEEFTNFFL